MPLSPETITDARTAIPNQHAADHTAERAQINQNESDIADLQAADITLQGDLAGHAADTTTHGTTGNVVGTSDSQTLTNKSIAFGSNTVSGTIAQFNTAVSDADLATLAGTETLTNKTLTGPVIADFTNAQHDHGDADDGGQIPAANIPITDGGGLFTATNVETALAETQTALNTAETAITDLEDETDPRSRVLTTGAPGGSARSWIRLEDEFFGSGTTAQQVGSLGWGATSSGAGAAVSNISAATAGRNSGVKRLSTGTTTTGYQNISLAANQIEGAPVFHCRFVFRIPTLGDATNSIITLIGLHDCITAGSGGVVTDGFFLYYSHDTNSGKFQSRASDAGSQTTADTGITAVANTWYTADAVCNGSGTVTWYMASDTGSLSQVSQHTSSTNFPDAGDVYSPLVVIEKWAGTTSRDLDVDYFFLYLEQAR